jgi:hypothetical protein
MRTISIVISGGGEPQGRKMALVLATVALIAGIGYVFWRLLDVVQNWAAATPWAAQIIQ